MKNREKKSIKLNNNPEQKKEVLTKEDFLKALTKTTKIVQKPEQAKKRK